MDLCKQATRRPGVRVSWQWWEQTGIDLKGAREMAAAAAAEMELESEDEPDGAAGGGSEEESQGASGSSGAGRRMTEPRPSTGQEQRRVQCIIL